MSTARIIYGFHAVTARLRQDAAGVLEIYLDASRHDARMRDLTQLAAERNVRTIAVDAGRLDGLAGGQRHQGVVAKVTTIKLPQDIDEVLDDLKEPALLLVLDGVQDPHNLGACLRVADALGVHAVVAPKDRAVGLTATAAKVASGAAETVPYIVVTNLARTLRELKERNIWVIGAEQSSGKTIYDVNLTASIAWVLGAEGEGMRRLTREHCDELAEIPMTGSVESLNVSVASGICLAETRRQRRL